MGLTVKVNGLSELITSIRNLPAAIQQKADSILQSNVQEMVRNAKRDAPRDMGRLGNAISWEKRAELVYAMICQVDYAPFIEFGTRGNYQPQDGVDASQFRGTGGGGQGFFQQILEWVKRKGLAGTYSTGIKKSAGGYVQGKSKGARRGSKDQQEQENEQVAFLIYRALLINGVMANPFFFKQGPIQEPKIQSAFAQLVNEQRF